MAKQTNTRPRDMVRCWIDGDMLMAQYADYSGPWGNPTAVRPATEDDMLIYSDRKPWEAIQIGEVNMPAVSMHDKERSDEQL